MNTAYWLHPNAYTNTTGFDARGAGFYNSATERFEDLLCFTAYWSSDAPTDTTCLAARLTCYCNILEIVDDKLTNGLSVRCVMDF
jgi:uncharacterized protein (TIGR02145 family)